MSRDVGSIPAASTNEIKKTDKNRKLTVENNNSLSAFLLLKVLIPGLYDLNKKEKAKVRGTKMARPRILAKCYWRNFFKPLNMPQSELAEKLLSFHSPLC